MQFISPRFFSPAVMPSDCEALLACQYQTDRCHVLLELHIKVYTHTHIHIQNHTFVLELTRTLSGRY